MVRTVPRNRPEDTGDLAELLDRTGILAASIPRQRRDSGVAESAEHHELVVPSRGVGRSAVLGWVAGALMLVVAFGGMYGMGQRDEPVEAAGGLVEEAPVSAPEVQAPIQPAPVQPRPVTPEPEPASSAPQPEPEPEPEPAVERPRPEPVGKPEARLDRSERESRSEPVTKLHKQVRDVVEPAFEVADSAFEMLPGFSDRR